MSISIVDGAATLGLWSVIALLILLPWFGAISSSASNVLAIGALSIALIASVALIGFGKPSDSRLPLALVSVLLFVSVAAFQLVPLHETVLNTLSPNQQQLRMDLGWLPASEEPLREVSNNESGGALHNSSVRNSVMDPAQNSRSGYSLSIAPAATRSYLSLMLLCASAWVAGSSFAAWEGSGIWLITTVAIGGLSWSVFVILARLIDLLGLSIPFVDSIINRSASGALNGYLLVALGCGIALMFLTIKRSRQRERSGKLGAEMSSGGSKRESAGIPESYIQEHKLESIQSSLSRFASRWSHRWLQSTWSVATILVLIGIAVLLGTGESVRERQSGIGVNQNETHPVTRDDEADLESLRWYEGFGLGVVTYKAENDRSPNSNPRGFLADHQYSNLVSEGGFGFLGLCLICLVWIASQAVLLWRQASDAADRALALSVLSSLFLFVVVGAITSSLVSATCLIPICCLAGAATMREVLAPRQNAKDERLVKRSSRRFQRLSVIPKPMSVLIVVALLLGALLSLRHAISEFRFQLVNRHAVDLLNEGVAADLDQVDQAIEELSALEADLAREDLSRRLGDLYVLRYRLAKADIVVRSSQIHDLDVAPGEAFSRASLANLYQEAHAAFLEYGDEGLAAKRSDPSVRGYLVPAIECYRNARLHCPLVAEDHLRLAQLGFLYESPENNDIHLQRAIRLAHGRNDILEAVGWIQSKNMSNQQVLKNIKDSCDLSAKIAATHLNDRPSLFSSSGMVVSSSDEVDENSTHIHHRFEYFNFGMNRQSATIGSGLSSSPQTIPSEIAKSQLKSVDSTASSIPLNPGWCTNRVNVFAMVALLGRPAIPAGAKNPSFRALTTRGESHRPRMYGNLDRVARTDNSPKVHCSIWSANTQPLFTKRESQSHQTENSEYNGRGLQFDRHDPVSKSHDANSPHATHTHRLDPKDSPSLVNANRKGSTTCDKTVRMSSASPTCL